MRESLTGSHSRHFAKDLTYLDFSFASIILLLKNHCFIRAKSNLGT